MNSVPILLLALILFSCPVAAKLVPVELLGSAQRAVISAKSDYSLMRGETEIAKFKSGSETVIDGTRITNKSQNYKLDGEYWFKADDLLMLDGRKYRGVIKVASSGLLRSARNDNNDKGIASASPRNDSGINIINELELEDYLRSVVASEMPSRWPLEALKAQAVCARTYTLATLKRKPVLKSGVADQMYLGYDKEDGKVDKAVKATQGEVLKDSHGNYIDAYYSSSAGNYTASVTDTWGLSPRPYLIAVDDDASGSSYKSWTREFSDAELTEKLADLKLNPVEEIEVFQRSIEGRATKLQVRGQSTDITTNDDAGKPHWRKSPNNIWADTESKPIKIHSRYLSGEELRHKLGLPSTNFRLSHEGERYRFSGTGYGHGLGMTQYGAKNMAEEGSSYQQILQHYYSEAKIAF